MGFGSSPRSDLFTTVQLHPVRRQVKLTLGLDSSSYHYLDIAAIDRPSPHSHPYSARREM